jgi:hypothetical protein
MCITRLAVIASKRSNPESWIAAPSTRDDKKTYRRQLWPPDLSGCFENRPINWAATKNGVAQRLFLCDERFRLMQSDLIVFAFLALVLVYLTITGEAMLQFRLILFRLRWFPARIK